jgi:sortase (surface protein transpeptidase)
LIYLANAPLVFEVEMLKIFKDANAFYKHEESKAKEQKEEKKDAETAEDEDL